MASDLISKLTRDRRFFGTCPQCGEEFRLDTASLFSLKDGFSEAALARIKEMKAELIERRRELKKMRDRMTKRSRITAESVNLGKILEKIAPSFKSFQFEAHDCRSLFEPIDYMIFSGLSKTETVEALIFLDVKSGGARLTNMQKEIAAVINNGQVEVDVIANSKGRNHG